MRVKKKEYLLEEEGKECRGYGGRVKRGEVGRREKGKRVVGEEN